MVIAAIQGAQEAIQMFWDVFPGELVELQLLYTVCIVFVPPQNPGQKSGHKCGPKKQNQSSLMVGLFRILKALKLVFNCFTCTSQMDWLVFEVPLILLSFSVLELGYLKGGNNFL